MTVRFQSERAAKGPSSDLEALFQGKTDPETNTMSWQRIRATYSNNAGKPRFKSIVFPVSSDQTLVERSVSASEYQLIGDMWIPKNIRQQDYTDRLKAFGNRQQIDRETTFHLVRAAPVVARNLFLTPETVEPPGAIVQTYKDGVAATFNFEPRLGTLAVQAATAIRQVKAIAQRQQTRGTRERNTPYVVATAIVLTLIVFWVLRRPQNRSQAPT